MFGFTYDTWRETCKMYFKLGDGSKKAYLQWFPEYYGVARPLHTVK